MIALRRRDIPDELNALTEQVVDSAIEVHRHLRAGHREAAYEEALLLELNGRGIPVERQVPFQLTYKGRSLSARLIADVVVSAQVIVEVKAVDQLHPLHEAQVLSYLAASECPVGLLMNFNAPTMRGQIRRFLRPVCVPHFRASVANDDS